MSDDQRWIDFWQDNQVYAYDPARPRDETFVVDTPPPTVSGSLHIGHVFSYTHTDLMVRYRRMRGDNILYRMGWDDNGLPTDRRVQNVFNVRCDLALPYDPDLKLEPGRQGDTLSVSRANYLDLADRLIAEDETKFKELWQHLALSLDWSDIYATIDRRSRRASQASFLRLVGKGEAFTKESVTMWDADFQTAVAQAEVEDREQKGHLYPVRFDIDGGGDVVIATTRPELLPACIAVIAHPDDDRYRHLIGRNALTPLFRAPVPIRAHEAADPTKGTGIMMVCTFGDIADVERWREWNVPALEVIGRDGRIKDVRWGSEPWVTRDAETALANYGRLVGLRVEVARKETVRLLEEAGQIAGVPEPVDRPVRFYEKGDSPLEYVTSRQWFIKLLEHRDALIEQGRKMTWHPELFLKRYENWVAGLNQDWCVSRQRPFGVPIPVWYGIREDGTVDYDQLLLPDVAQLPIDPSIDVPAGYKPEQRTRPNGFTGDADVFDTWATSSLTPYIIAGWPDDMERYRRTFPADLRPHAHEIIRTWTFYSVVRAYLEDGSLPFTNVAISGFVVDPDRKKMSKSRGNVVLPTAMIDEYGADAVRYWAGSASLGLDAINDPAVFREGKRLVTKMRNASRFVLNMAGDPGPINNPLDAALIAQLRQLVETATAAWDRWDHAAALRATEAWFWSTFCDNYIELVKERAYAGDGSALTTLRTALDVVLRLFAPFLPYVTEEVWNGDAAHLLPTASLRGDSAARSIHRAIWPSASELQVAGDPMHFDLARDVLGRIRKAKSDAQVGLGAPVAKVTITGPSGDIERVSAVRSDILAAAKAQSHDVVVDDSATGLAVAVRIG